MGNFLHADLKSTVIGTRMFSATMFVLQKGGWENTFADTSDEGLISKIYKELTKLNIKNSKNPIKNGQRT